MNDALALAILFDGTAEQLRMLLQQENTVRQLALLCNQVGHLVLPDSESLTEEEIISFFRLMVEDEAVKRQKEEER